MRTDTSRRTSVEVGIRLSGKVHGIVLFCPRYRD